MPKYKTQKIIFEILKNYGYLIPSLNLEYMSSLDVTKLVLIQGTDKIVTIQADGVDLEYDQFFDMILMLVSKAGYSKEETESYILEWANIIRQQREN